VGRRIKQPVNEDAYWKATKIFYDNHPTITVDVTPAHPEYKKLRKEWLSLYEAHGGKVKDTKADQGGDAVVAYCIPYDNAIEAVYILDGGDDMLLVGEGTQYVNLPREPKFVDSARVKSVDRLSRELRVKVVFRQKRRAVFWIEMLAHQDNAEYTDDEKSARSCYDYERAPATHPRASYRTRHGATFSGTTDDTGSLIFESGFAVTPAVGDRYQFVAWDEHGNKVYSATITTRRLLFYMTMIAYNAANVMPPDVYLPMLEKTYADEHTDLVFLGNEVLGKEQLRGYDPPSPHNAGAFLKAIVNPTSEKEPSSKTGFRVGRYADLMPYLLRIAFVDQICSASWRVPFTEEVEATIGPGQASVRVPVIFPRPPDAPPLRPGDDLRKPLWHGLGPSVDHGSRATVPDNHWFVDAYFNYSKDDEIDIPAHACAPIETAPGTGRFNEIEVRVDELSGAVKKGKLYFRPIVVGTAISGLAREKVAPGAMLLAARYMFEPQKHDEQLAATIHEVGHGLYMVADPSDSGIDRHEGFYRSAGNHCHSGLSTRSNDDKYEKDQELAKRRARCVMFGIGLDPPRLSFCERCKAALRKIDISAGLMP
jgi:hypothetical protein